MPRLPDLGIAAALFLFASGLILFLVLSSVSTTIDDGFYYLKIAQEIARGAGSTFDDVHPTNGYHPLWLLLLVPLCEVSSPAAALRLATLLQGALWGAAAGVLYLTARRWCGAAASAFAALAWLAFTCREAASGLELSLHALCVAATAYLYARLESSDSPRAERACLLLGTLAALTVLARLETALLAALLGLFLAAREARAGCPRGALRRLAAFGAPVVAVSGAYLLVNLRLFGHPIPVSGAVKGDWSRTLLSQDPFYLAGGWAAAKVHHLFFVLRFSLVQRRVLLAGTLLPLALWIAGAGSRRARLPEPFRPLLDFQRPFVLYGSLQLVACAVFFHGALSVVPWYFVVQPWLAALWAGTLFEVLLRASRLRGSLLGTAALAVLWGAAPLVALSRVRAERERLAPARQPLLVAAEWARENLPEDATIGAWNAGTLGYLSGRRVVDLDGVANSWDFALKKRRDLCAYFREASITHVVDLFDGGKARSAVPTYASYASCADRLELIGSVEGAAQRADVYRIR
jgi:hypothetical protein